MSQQSFVERLSLMCNTGFSVDVNSDTERDSSCKVH